MTAGARTTSTVTAVQPVMAAGKPMTPSGSNATVRNATRSPSAKVAATAAASQRQHTANPRNDAARRRPTVAYRKPPMPMPASATASTSPNVKTDPPRSGPRSRYQTSSIKKNANPTVAAATSRNDVGAATGLRGSTAWSSETASAPAGRSLTPASPGSLLLSSALRAHFRSRPRAITATRALVAAANHNVARVPNTSSSKNVAIRQPKTAPMVFAA